MRLEPEHDVAELRLCSIRGRDLLDGLLADARDLAEPVRRLLDDGQRLLAELLHDALGQSGPDAVDDAGGQEALDALGARRRLDAEARDLELLPEALMCRPVATQAQLLADEGGLDIGDCRDAAVLAQGLEGKDGEGSRFIRKDDALDDTLDLLLHLQPRQGLLDWSAFFVLHLAASSHRGCLRPRSGAPTSRSASRSPSPSPHTPRQSPGSAAGPPVWRGRSSGTRDP